MADHPNTPNDQNSPIDPRPRFVQPKRPKQVQSASKQRCPTNPVHSETVEERERRKKRQKQEAWPAGVQRDITTQFLSHVADVGNAVGARMDVMQGQLDGFNGRMDTMQGQLDTMVGDMGEVKILLTDMVAKKNPLVSPPSSAHAPITQQPIGNTSSSTPSITSPLPTVPVSGHASSSSAAPTTSLLSPAPPPGQPALAPSPLPSVPVSGHASSTSAAPTTSLLSAAPPPGWPTLAPSHLPAPPAPLPAPGPQPVALPPALWPPAPPPAWPASPLPPVPGSTQGPHTPPAGMHHGVAHPSAFSTPVLPTWDDPWGGAKPVKLVNKEQRLISAQRARAASMAVFIPPTDFANASRRQTKLGRQNTAIDALTKEIEAHYTLQRQRLRLVNPDLSLTQQQHTPILNGPTAQSAPGADDSDWQDVLMAIDDPKLRDKAHAIMQGKGKGKGPAGPDGN